MGIKVRVKRLSCLGSCLNRPILELRWSHEERVYDVGECEGEPHQNSSEGHPGEVCFDAAWNGHAADNALALKQIAMPPDDETRLEILTARVINFTA
jgi:hypothetical protein